MVEKSTNKALENPKIVASKPKRKRKHKRKPSKARKDALEKIERLFMLADEVFKEDADQANRYVELARKTAMKIKLKMPSVYKRRFCKHCYCYLRPSVNCRVRLNNGNVVYYCLECKKFNRVGYRERKVAGD